MPQICEKKKTLYHEKTQKAYPPKEPISIYDSFLKYSLYKSISLLIDPQELASEPQKKTFNIFYCSNPGIYRYIQIQSNQSNFANTNALTLQESILWIIRIGYSNKTNRLYHKVQI